MNSELLSPGYIFLCFIALIMGVGLLQKLTAASRMRGPVQLMGHLRLDVRRWLYLVRVGDRVLVVGAGDGVITKLCELPVSEVEKTSEAKGAE